MNFYNHHNEALPLSCLLFLVFPGTKQDKQALKHPYCSDVIAKDFINKTSLTVLPCWHGIVRYRLSTIVVVQFGHDKVTFTLQTANWKLPMLYIIVPARFKVIV